VRVYGGSKNADMPDTQPVHSGLRVYILAGSETSGEQGLYIAVYSVRVSTPNAAPAISIVEDPGTSV